MRARVHLIALVLVALAVGCGKPVSTAPSESEVASELFADAVISVSSDAGDGICFAAEVSDLGVEFERRCWPEASLVINEVAVASAEPAHFRGGAVSFFVVGYPLTVTSVRQDGHEVPWRQDGDGILIAGYATNNADTEFNFEIDRTRAQCRFGPSGGSCLCPPDRSTSP